MVRVLIADDDLDSHELIDDLIEINFRDVEIERALTKESFLIKIGTAKSPYNLILFNLDIEKAGNGREVVEHLEANHPELLKRMVFISSDVHASESINADYLVLTKPFSLDRFGEVVQKVCDF
jgi:DNA-binding NtrC family response regulator